MKIALIGATGMVGKVMINLIHERKIKYKQLILVASDKSQGQKILVKKNNLYGNKTINQRILLINKLIDLICCNKKAP